MLGVMYTINKDVNGVTLTCNQCLHAVRVNEFDDRLGNPRTQAASAMLKHAFNEHSIKLIGKPSPRIMERMY